ncbi:MAG: LD-carboxypeptidase [Desulfarculaceae bacterium]
MIPARLPVWPRPGQLLALVAPAGYVRREEFEAGLEVLGRLLPGQRLLIRPSLFDQDGYLAGDDFHRAARLNRVMLRPDVGAVLCVRGGFGASRLLPRLDWKALVQKETLIMGFSDVTALLNLMASQGLVTVHGPGLGQLARLDEQSLQETASLLKGKPPWPAELKGAGVAGGKASGPLFGGNLTMMCHLLGTPYFPQLQGAILLLEEVNEAPYRLDRLLTQLELAGVLDQVAGLALGNLGQDQSGSPSLEEVATRRLARLDKPVVMGLPVGHGPENRPLPLGAMAHIDGSAGLVQVGAGIA